MKKTLALLMCATLLLSTLISCGSENGGSNQSSTETSAPEESLTEETVPPYNDNLPEGLDFTGREVVFLIRSDDEFQNEITVDGENGEVVNDAVYSRNISVEDRLGAKISAIATAQDGFNDFVKKSVLSGDEAFDIVAGYQYYIPQLVAEDMFLNIYDVGHIDPSQPYWANEISSRTTINGKMYLLAGDLATSMLRDTVVMYFNKNLATDYNIPDSYQTVLDNKWTLDTLETTVKGTYRDIDGNGERNEGDVYGFVLVNGNYVNQFTRSCDIPITQADENGAVSIVLYNEKCVNFFDRLKSLLYTTEDAVGEGIQSIVGAVNGENSAQFAANQILFYPAALSTADKLRDMKSDFGIIPLPKWDEAQERYMTSAIDHFSLFAIPVTVTDTEPVGAVLEAMCALSADTSVTAYYEVVLKTKYSRDDTSHQMLDLITAGITFDFAQIYSSTLNNLGNVIKDYMSTDNVQDFTSYYTSKEKSFQNSLDKLIEYFMA